MKIANYFGRVWLLALALIGPVQAALACTIFVLADTKRTLFFNNEDYSNPATRIWFLPATKDDYGCAYLGFNDDWAQGGVNEYGLAFDWVASGTTNGYVPAADLKTPRGNPAERMLESCKTVPEAIAFYHRYAEPGFAASAMLIADKTGASVIIHVRNGQLQYEVSHQSRGFGYGDETLKKMLRPSLRPTLENGLPILRACRQEGQYATKYASVYDLRSGEIHLSSLAGKEESVRLDLAAELKKGGHFYDLPLIRQQQLHPPVPLLADMKRYLGEGYEPFPAAEPAVTALVTKVLKEARAGELHPEDFTPALWQQIGPAQKQMQPELEKLGDLLSVTLVKREENARLYLEEFQKATVLQRIELDATNRIALLKSEAAEMKVGTVRAK
jgi:hypothetical protein